VLPERGVIASALRRAICRVSVNDADLLGEDANERSVMFRIGLYLANIIETEWSGGWNVDLEYNRMNSGQRRVPKAVLGLHLDDQDRTRNRQALGFWVVSHLGYERRRRLFRPHPTCCNKQDHFRYRTASVVTADPRATGRRFVFWYVGVLGGARTSSGVRFQAGPVRLCLGGRHLSRSSTPRFLHPARRTRRFTLLSLTENLSASPRAVHPAR